ncbi:unnamed protein product [Timema podura]|uniref:DNA mismatch repair protein S5 domain-containing protein n=1 Tax=Timema podura TaxID=61482 RepID=A0ABN7NSR6_TIMPD|nr:unnamed protein product [Timema podura]
MSVRKLPEEVQSLLRTGININCPSQCVIELVLNAIDAGATSIAVRVDLRYFKFQVVDNGHGMDLENIDRVGSRYMTSKCHTLQDLYSHLDFFGFRGEALASLRELSGILALESRPSGNEQTYCKVFTHGKSHRAGLANTKRPSVGTTVTVTDFMYNMPVRRKRIKEAVDLEEIKSQLECIALMHPQVSISLRNDVKYNIIMQTHRTTDTLKVFSNLFGDTISKSLVPVLFELDRFKVSGYIGKISHPQKNLQFIYVNKRLILKSKLHKLVDALLAKSFILRANGPWKNVPISKKLDSRFFIACSPPEKRNKYGVYVLNVECSYCDYDIALDPRKTLVEFKDWDSILKCTEEAVRSFLEKESLVFSGDLDSDYRSSPSRDVGKLCDESLICEMDQLSKECALALPDHPSKLIDTNTFVDPPRKSVGVDALNGAGMVHGLPARRKAFVKEKILASSSPQSPNISNTGLNIDNQASKLNLFESTLVSEVDKCSENPLPSSTFSVSILSSKGLKRKCDKSDIKSKEHFVKPAIPQKKHKCSMNKINSVSSRASSVSADSEDPLFSCKHYLTKSKPKNDLISLPKLTKECRLTPCESRRENGSSFVCEIKTSTAVQTSASLDNRPVFFSDIIASVPENEDMLDTASYPILRPTKHTKMSTPVTVSSGSIPCGQDGKTPNNSPRIISTTYSKDLFSNLPTQINSGASNLIDGSPFLIRDHHIGSSEMIMNDISTELCSKDYDSTGSQNHCAEEGDKSKLSSPIKEVINANMISLTQQSTKHCPSSSFVCETISNGKSSPMMHAANDSTTLSGRKRNNEISHDNNSPYKKICVDDVTLTLPSGTNNSPCLSAKQTDVLSLSVTSQELIRAMDDAVQSMSNCGVLANCIPLNGMADSVAVNAMEAMPEPQVARLIDLESCKGSEDSSNVNQWMKATDSEGGVFYVHKRSGITSFDAPVPTQDQVSFSMINRCSFLPKGMSPILKTSSCKPIKNDASLMPTSCQMMKDVISRSNSLQDELAVIKWRDLLEVQDSGCKPYVTQLLDDAENRMKYCEQPVPNAKIIDKCAINIYNVMFPYAFTREMFSSIKVLGQMDRKFIVTLASVAGSKKPHVIVLFDQHAVHERIRLEKLMKDKKRESLCGVPYRLFL